MQGGSALTLNVQARSTRRWMLILVTCICIIKQSKQPDISILNVRVCECNAKQQLLSLKEVRKNLPWLFSTEEVITQSKAVKMHTPYIYIYLYIYIYIYIYCL